MASVSDCCKRFVAKDYHSVMLYFYFGNLENLVNNRLGDHPVKCDLLYDFNYSSKSCCSVAVLLKEVSDKINRAFNVFATIDVVAWYIEGFAQILEAGFLHKFKS